MRHVILALWLVVLASSAPGADNSLAGTWRLDTKRSTLKASAPQIQVLRVSAGHENVRITLDGLTQEGLPFQITLNGQLDDCIYSVGGVPFMDAVSGMRLDDHTILIRTLKSGHIERGKATTTRDGKTLRVEFFTLDGNSNGVKTIATFHRQ